MKQSIRTIFAPLAASVLGLGVVAGALAVSGQGPGGYSGMMGPGMMGPGMMGGPGVMGASVAETVDRLAAIKGDLGIGSAQEEAWNTYQQAVITQSALMNAHWQTMLNGPMPPTGDQRAVMHGQGLDQMQQLAQARNALYRVLTPKQRAKADGLLTFQHGPGMAWQR